MAQRLVSLFGLLIVLAFPIATQGEEALPDVLIFYRDGCTDCRHMDLVLDDLLALYPGIVVRHIEENDPDGGLMWTLATHYGIFPSKFPVIYVGDEAIVGSSREKELRLRAAVSSCAFKGCESPMSLLDKPSFPWLIILVAGLIGLVVAFMLLE